MSSTNRLAASRGTYLLTCYTDLLTDLLTDLFTDLLTGQANHWATHTLLVIKAHFDWVQAMFLHVSYLSLHGQREEMAKVIAGKVHHTLRRKSSAKHLFWCFSLSQVGDSC